MNKKAIVVVGTGRSGTSMFAGVLHHLGVFMGKEFIPGDRNNPQGHYEDKAFADLNRDVVDGKIDFPYWAKETEKLFKKRLEEQKTERWGWKIPSTTNLMDLYRKLNFDVEFVWIHRNPEESIDSCLRAYSMTEAVARNLIMKRYNILKEQEELGEIDHKYEMKEFIKNPEKTIDKVIKDLKLKPTKEQRQKAIDSIYEKKPKKERPKVLVSVPTMGSVHTLLASRLVNIAANRNYDKLFNFTMNVSPVDRAREDLVATFLKTDCTHLLMIDSDTIPPEDGVEKLLELDKPVATGITPILHFDKGQTHISIKDNYYSKYNCVGLDGENLKADTGIHEVLGAGGSFLLIKREVLEKMTSPHFRNVWEDDTGAPHFISEDVFFITKARKEGFKSYADSSVVCWHSKPIIF